MALRQEQVVFIAAAVLLGFLAWRLEGAPESLRGQGRSSSGALPFEHHSAPPVELALPEPGAPRGIQRGIFAPPRDTHPLDPLELVVPEGHPLAGRGEVALAEAAGEAWVAGPPDGSYHQIMLQACARAVGLSESWQLGHRSLTQLVQGGALPDTIKQVAKTAMTPKPGPSGHLCLRKPLVDEVLMIVPPAPRSFI